MCDLEVSGVRKNMIFPVYKFRSEDARLSKGCPPPTHRTTLQYFVLNKKMKPSVWILMYNVDINAQFYNS